MGFESAIAQPLGLPTGEEMMANLEALAARDEAVGRCLRASRTAVFEHPDGRTDQLKGCRVAPLQLALISHLVQQSAGKLTIEVGFGMGTSATMILGTHRAAGKPFEHLIFDPWGLGDERGTVVQNYLENEFPEFKRVYKKSQVGLGQLYDERGPECAGFIFIDGCHTFESVLTDFVLSDLLCAVGGYIVFDDAYYPGIETAVNYIVNNRRDYLFAANDPVHNTVVIRKIAHGGLPWSSFRPFAVPNREGWTPAIENW